MQWNILLKIHQISLSSQINDAVQSEIIRIDLVVFGFYG